MEFKDDQTTDCITLVEFGAGYSLKTEIIINTLLQKNVKVNFVPIDVSSSACEYTAEKYKSLISVNNFVGTYDDYFKEKISYSNRVFYLWLGSSIGNLENKERNEFLTKVGDLMTFRDVFLIGFDTVYKDTSIIYNAYNDKFGVTAKFILNILTHIKLKYNLNLSESDFKYEGVWDVANQRMEMYLKVIDDTYVSDEKGEKIFLPRNERILVEYSHKFSIENIECMAVESNLLLINCWSTKDKYYMFASLVKSIQPIWDRTNLIFKSHIGYENLVQRPIHLRNSFIFYFGHLYAFYDIKVFNLNPESLIFQLFERGRDPEVSSPDNCHRHSEISVDYPHYSEILEYISKIQTKVKEFIVQNGYSYNIMTCIEHEMMHQETLFYMLRMTKIKLHINDYSNKTTENRKIVKIPERNLTIGTNETFCWDNESPAHNVTVKSFYVDSLPITWNDMLEFIKENPCNVIEKIINLRLLDNYQIKLRISESIWSSLEISGDTPAIVSLEVAKLFVFWKNQKGIKCRIMTETEYDSLTSTLKDAKKGNIDFKNYHTTPVGFYNDYSDDGVGELIGNGWELTESLFRPFEGFKPMNIYKEYSADFFTDNHYVLKGASPFTSALLCRKSFRNWYQYNYAYHISKFRLVYDEI